MKREVKSSLLWGLIGAFSYLVLIQGYHLVTGTFTGIVPMVVVAAGVFVVSALTTHLVRPHVRRRANERT